MGNSNRELSTKKLQQFLTINSKEQTKLTDAIYMKNAQQEKLKFLSIFHKLMIIKQNYLSNNFFRNQNTSTKHKLLKKTFKYVSTFLILHKIDKKLQLRFKQNYYRQYFANRFYSSKRSDDFICKQKNFCFK